MDLPIETRGSFEITDEQAATYRRIIRFLNLKRGLKGLYATDEQWLWTFLKTEIDPTFPHQVMETFKLAKDQFQNRPIRTGELREGVAIDLATQEMAKWFLSDIIVRPDSFGKCWLIIHSGLQGYFNEKEALTPESSRSSELTNGNPIAQFLDEEPLEGDMNEVAAKIRTFGASLEGDLNLPSTSCE